MPGKCSPSISPENIEVSCKSSYRSCPVKKMLFKILQYQIKTPMLESFFNKVSLLFSCEYCEIFANAYFEEHLRTTTSVPDVLNQGI